MMVIIIKNKLKSQKNKINYEKDDRKNWISKRNCTYRS